MKNLCFLFALVVFINYFKLAHASYEEIEGFSLKEIHLEILPKGFIKDTSIDGTYYSDSKTGSSIVINEIASPALLKLLLEEEMNKKPSFQILNKEEVLIQQMKGELYHIQTTENGKSIKLWMLLLGEKQKWIEISGSFEEKYEVELSNDIKESILSVQWNKQKFVSKEVKIDKDVCYESIAKKNIDEKLCARIVGHDIQMACYKFVAEAKKDYEICENVSKDKFTYRSCIFGVALKRGECEKLKDKIQDNYLLDTCYSYQTTTVRITSKDNKCDVNKDEISRNLCEKLKSQVITVKDLCDRITNPAGKENCLKKDLSSTRVNYFDYAYQNPIDIPDECHEILGTLSK